VHFAFILKNSNSQGKLQSRKKNQERKTKTAKKEENFSANLPKKIQAKKIHFQTARFAPFSNRPWQPDIPIARRSAIQPQAIVVSARSFRVILIFSAAAFRCCPNSASLQPRRAISSSYDALGLGLGGFGPFAAAVMRAEFFAHLFEEFHSKLFLAETPAPPHSLPMPRLVPRQASASVLRRVRRSASSWKIGSRRSPRFITW